MMTNTYLPHVGGVARSVSTFSEEYRRQKHAVLVVAPEFPGRPPPARAEAMVERVAPIKNFNGRDFFDAADFRRDRPAFEPKVRTLEC